MIYENENLVRRLTEDCVANGETVFQIHWLAPTERGHVSRLLEAFDPHGVVLDAGCGVGAVAAMMQEERPDLDFVLLNISQAQLDMCPDRFKKLRGSFHAIPMDAESVDCAMFNYSLGHGDISTCMKEAARVMRKGGVLFIYDLATENNDLLSKALEYHAHSIGQMLDAAEESGFRLTHALAPISPYIDHFMNKMTREQFDAVFQGVQPVMLRFELE